MGVDAAGCNADLITTGTSNTATGISAVEIESTTTVTGSANVRILRPVPSSANDPASANAKWEVMINEHALKNATGV